jgi:hypothetical protein
MGQKKLGSGLTVLYFYLYTHDCTPVVLGSPELGTGA